MNSIAKILIGSLALFLSSSLWGTWKEDFAQGNAQYQSGHYEEAIKSFHAALATHHSLEIYFNLANAYVQNKQLGYAILYYERARLQDPNNPEIVKNLHFVKEQLGILPDEGTRLQKISNFFTANTWTWLVMFWFWLGFGLILTPFLYPLKKGLLIFSGVISWMLALVFSYFLWQQARDFDLGVTITPETPMKVSPAENAQVQQFLHIADAAHIIGEHNDYFKIQTSTQQIGWVKKSDFHKIRI